MGEINKTLNYTNPLDEIIDRYKKDPWVYDDNVYVCYEACKTVIRRMERESKIRYEDYDLYIQYITNKLGI